MRNRWPGWAPLGAAFGLGAVLATGQAPLGFWWLALPALVALIALVTRAPTRAQAAWTALFGGMGYCGLALSWIVEPFLIDVVRHGWMAPFALLFMAFGLALFWAAAATLAHLAPPRARPMALALTLAGADLVRGYILTGFPWALIGHVWIGTPLDQIAILIGPSGLSLMTTLAAALPVAHRRAGLIAAALILGCATTFGYHRLTQPLPPDRPATLRLVQPNATQQDKWDPDRAAMFLNRQLDFTAADPRPDLVIWPETAVPYLLNDSGDLGLVIATAARGAPVALGIQRSVGMRAWNSLVVFDKAGGIKALYDKHHLVPFGEYLPFGDLLSEYLGITAMAARDGNGYSAGPGPQLIDLGPPLGRVLPLICYEAVFPQDLRGTPRPDWLLQITNDAWFGTLTGPYQHLAQARLRAIEQGLPLIRVANTGVSAVIDARGRVRATLPLGQAGWLDAPLPAALPATPYARYGEVPVLLLLAGIAAALIAAHRPRRT